MIYYVSNYTDINNATEKSLNLSTFAEIPQLFKALNVLHVFHLIKNCYNRGTAYSSCRLRSSIAEAIIQSQW